MPRVRKQVQVYVMESTDMAFKFEDQMGGTSYSIEKGTGSETHVKITRLNSEGLQQTWIPEDLFIKYAEQWVTTRIRKVMPEFLGVLRKQ